MVEALNLRQNVTLPDMVSNMVSFSFLYNEYFILSLQIYLLGEVKEVVLSILVVSGSS